MYTLYFNNTILTIESNTVPNILAMQFLAHFEKHSIYK